MQVYVDRTAALLLLLSLGRTIDDALLGRVLLNLNEGWCLLGAGWGGSRPPIPPASSPAPWTKPVNEGRNWILQALLNQGNTISSLSDPNLASTLLLLINNSESSMMQSQCNTVRAFTTESLATFKRFNLDNFKKGVVWIQNWVILAS